MKTIFLLGGYGRIGPHVAHWLLRQTDAAIVVAGRHKEQADQLATQLNGEVPGRRATAVVADATSADSLLAALRGVDLVIDCTSSARNTESIARAAITSGADYLDYHFSSTVLPTLRSLATDIERSGRCFITQLQSLVVGRSEVERSERRAERGQRFLTLDASRPEARDIAGAVHWPPPIGVIARRATVSLLRAGSDS